MPAGGIIVTEALRVLRLRIARPVDRYNFFGFRVARGLTAQRR
jgi:hypothetical protein